MDKTEGFVIGCYPNTDEKIKILEETIKKIKLANLPIIIVSHYFIPKHIFDQVDYIIYDRQNVISDWRLNYWIVYPKFLKVIGKMQGMGYHAVACLSLIMNAILFCRNKYDIIHYIESDVDFNVDKYLQSARSRLLEQNFNFYGFKYELYEGIRSNIFSCKTNWYYHNVPDVRTWEEYTKVAETLFDRVDFILEFWLYYVFKSKNLLNECYIEEMSNLKQYIINQNILDTGETDPRIKIFSSELDDGKNVILFILNGTSEIFPFKIIHSGGQIHERIIGNQQTHYLILPKDSGRCQIIINNKLFKEYNFNINNDYLESTFRFYDDRVKCIQWDHTHDNNLIN